MRKKRNPPKLKAASLPGKSFHEHHMKVNDDMNKDYLILRKEGFTWNALLYLGLEKAKAIQKARNKRAHDLASFIAYYFTPNQKKSTDKILISEPGRRKNVNHIYIKGYEKLSPNKFRVFYYKKEFSDSTVYSIEVWRDQMDAMFLMELERSNG